MSKMRQNSLFVTPHTRIEDDSLIEEKYIIGATLGEGSFGTVFEATNREDDTKWAIKVVNKEKAGTAGTKMVEREIAILKKVKHEHIIYMREVFETPTKTCIVLELCDRGELSKLFEITKPFSESDVKTIMHRLTSAISYLHKNEIVHRDLKLDNILLCTNQNDPNDRFNIKLNDFGLSLIKGKVGTDGLMMQVCGTPLFMSPEMLSNQNYSHLCDVWSLGVIMYILLCGDPPFKGSTREELTNNIIKADVAFNEPAWESISEKSKDVIRGSLKADPAHRLTAGEILEQGWFTGLASQPINVLEMMKLFKEEDEIDDDDRESISHMVTEQVEESVETEYKRTTLEAPSSSRTSLGLKKHTSDSVKTSPFLKKR